MKNEAVREAFSKFYIEYCKPNYKCLAKEMGLSYYSFIKWKNGQIEYSEASLNKIMDFLKQKKGA